MKLCDCQHWLQMLIL